VPTNGYFTERTVEKTRGILEEPGLELLVVELSLEGLPHFHDTLRRTRNAFKKAIETYDALAELQREDPRLRIHAVSTATHANLEEIKRLSTYLYERCPRIDHHSLAIIRGDRKDPSLEGPALDEYTALYEYIRRLWGPREKGRYGSIVEPMLQWAKVKTIREKGPGVTCTAGQLSGVVYANGDVSLCEGQGPVGNLREAPFADIWRSARADALRKTISERQCYCTTEVFMWPGIVHQPSQLARAMWGARVWTRPKPLGPGERVPVVIGPDGLPVSDPRERPDEPRDAIR
jgi:MoaA/NifB/PqqE/SkfB family radical SAM enzyme